MSQLHDSAPGIRVGNFADIAADRRHLLNNKAAQLLAVCCKVKFGFELLALGHVVFKIFCNGIAFQRNHSLIGLNTGPAVLRIENKGAEAFSVFVDQFLQIHFRFNFGPFADLSHRANAHRIADFGINEGNRAGTLHLKNQAAFTLNGARKKQSAGRELSE